MLDKTTLIGAYFPTLLLTRKEQGVRFVHGYLFVLLLLSAIPFAAAASPSHGLAMHGKPKYPADFTHFDYVNPDAPKGGRVTLATIGSFDSLNPFIIQGSSATGLGLIFDTLASPSNDEAFTKYGLIAESVETPEDRSWVTFRLRKEARFHDGHPITAEDVVFSFNTLLEDGQPFYRSYYGNVETVETPDDHTVTFRFKPGENRELPLILGQLIVLPKHWWQGRDFTQPGLDIPLGSGPYRVLDLEPGRYIAFERVKEYWGRDLPVNKGRYNFDQIRYEYYRDRTLLFEGFKAGEYDLRGEFTAKNWAIRYDFPAVRDGRIKREELAHNRPSGMQGWVMNTRRPVFADRRVRLALNYAYNFEWASAAYQYGAYRRSASYFSNSELGATGLPQGEELEILQRFRDRLAPEIFTDIYRPSSYGEEGATRRNLLRALKLFDDAGWEMRDAKLVNRNTGEPFEFEILLVQPAFEQYALAYRHALQRIGITASIRITDTSQYFNRLRDYDFDMVIGTWAQSDSPGNEQRLFWNSEIGQQPGSRNLAGISDPVIDELIELVIAAPSRESLVQRVRALDRALIWGHYVVPQWHNAVDRVAFWDMFGRPDITPKDGYQITAWWIDPDRARALGRGGF